MFLSLAQPTVLFVLLLSLLLFAGTSFTSSVKHSKQLLKSHKKLMIKNRVHSGAEEKVVEVVEGGGGSVPPSVPATNDSPNESKEEAQAEVVVTAAEMADQNDDLWFDPQKKNPVPGPGQKVQPRKNVKLILFGPSSTAEKLAVLKKIIADDGDPKLSVLRKKAALYKEALEVEAELKRGGGGGSTVSLKQAQADVKMAAFELRTVWQRLARTSGKVLQSKWAWGAGAIAGGLAIRQGYNQYLEKLARGEKGSYLKGNLNQNPVPPINNELAEGEGGPPPLLLSPSPNSNAADGSGSLLFGGVIFALLVLLCACCGCYVLYNAVNNPHNELNQFNLIRAGGGGKGKGGRGGGEGNEPSTSTGGTSRNKSRSSGRRRHSA